MILLQQTQPKELIRFKLVTCYSIEGHPGTLLLQANTSVIPKTQFKEVLIAIGQHVVKNDFHKIILDENLVTSLSPYCLEWYHSVWKELMVYHGLKTHCFIVPEGHEVSYVETLPGISFHSSVEDAVALD